MTPNSGLVRPVSDSAAENPAGCEPFAYVVPSITQVLVTSTDGQVSGTFNATGLIQSFSDDVSDVEELERMFSVP